MGDDAFPSTHEILKEGVPSTVKSLETIAEQPTYLENELTSMKKGSSK